MGIDVRWENESGNLLEEVPDPKDYFSLALTLKPLDKTVCLRFIDPYGDTVFNQQQIPVFISELQALQHITTDRIEVSNHISKILDLANRSKGEIHTYLKLYGD